MLEAQDYEGLPGAAWILRGLGDLAQGRRTPEALCIAAAPARLRDLDVPVPDSADRIREPELALYEALCRQASESDDPYFTYNALRRELDSFIAALESRKSRGLLAAAEAPSAP